MRRDCAVFHTGAVASDSEMGKLYIYLGLLLFSVPFNSFLLFTNVKQRRMERTLGKCRVNVELTRDRAIIVCVRECVSPANVWIDIRWKSRASDKTTRHSGKWRTTGRRSVSPKSRL